MHENSVALVRDYYGAANRRDIDAVRRHLAPEIEFHLSGVFPDLAPVYRGHAEVERFFEEFTAPWEDLSIEPERITEATEDRVLALVHFQARGRDGVEVQLPLAHLWTLRNGLAVRLDAYADRRHAVEAAGL
jgi:ketosteroid isomerase-like protein